MVRMYEAVFNYKIDLLKDHPKYEHIRKNFADRCLRLHRGYGYEAIAAADFMDRVIVMPIDYIRRWADGENNLEWSNKKTGETFEDSEKHVLDRMSEQYKEIQNGNQTTN